MSVEGFLLTKSGCRALRALAIGAWPWVLSQSEQWPSVNLWLGVREFDGLKSARAQTMHH